MVVDRLVALATIKKLSKLKQSKVTDSKQPKVTDSKCSKPLFKEGQSIV